MAQQIVTDETEDNLLKRAQKNRGGKMSARRRKIIGAAEKHAGGVEGVPECHGDRFRVEVVCYKGKQRRDGAGSLKTEDRLWVKARRQELLFGRKNMSDTRGALRERVLPRSLRDSGEANTGVRLPAASCGGEGQEQQAAR